MNQAGPATSCSRSTPRFRGRTNADVLDRVDAVDTLPHGRGGVSRPLILRTTQCPQCRLKTTTKRQDPPNPSVCLLLSHLSVAIMSKRLFQCERDCNLYQLPVELSELGLPSYRAIYRDKERTVSHGGRKAMIVQTVCTARGCFCLGTHGLYILTTCSDKTKEEKTRRRATKRKNCIRTQ